MKSCIIKLSIASTLLLAQVCSSTALKGSPPTELEILVTDIRRASLPVRVHLVDQNGKAQAVEGQPFWHDHFVIPGQVTAPLAPGKYDVAIERGPEYKRHNSQIEIAAGTHRKLAVRLERI